MHRYFNIGRPRVSMPLLELIAGLVSPPEAPDERYFHEDVAHLADDALRLERHRLRLAIPLLERPSAWVLERLTRLDAEIEVRPAR